MNENTLRFPLPRLACLTDELRQVRMELSVRASAKPNSKKNLTFEVCFLSSLGSLCLSVSLSLTEPQVLIAWDPGNFLPPHLVMKSLTQLDKKKSGEVTRTPLTCPESKQ